MVDPFQYRVAPGPPSKSSRPKRCPRGRPPNPNQNLQNQLILQATQASLISYKDYKVGPEDQLAIVIFGQDKPNRELRVNGQGEITMPVVLVKVAGLTAQDIENRLEQL